ncbi:hypothetical protein SteCoe_18865 [Stentor coeruleus]|uniref:Uncharacterized protein n=1 Tax=Stentor coeruleus TaxID=5963 RepID=A0A1R2BVL4_9CILI|nr:hypothetical protein SteCoe_18865 [Stentor coeruleus]
MNFQNKEFIDISFEDYDEFSSQVLPKNSNISDLYDNFPNTSQKLPNSVQDFLLRSDQIQEDIRKKNDKSPDFKKSPYKKINEKLKSLGFSNEISPITTFESFFDTLDNILTEFIYTVNKLNEAEKNLKETFDKKKDKERDKRNKKLYNEFKYISNDSNLEDLFKEIMNRELNLKNEEDYNIITFIKYTEIQRAKLVKKIQDFTNDKDNCIIALQDLEYKNKELALKLKKNQMTNDIRDKIKILDQILIELNLKSVKELPEAINKFQQVMFALPSVEKFVADISEEFVNDPNCKKLEDILVIIKSQKKNILEADDFRRRVCQAFGTEKLKDFISYGRALSHFCKLFEVKNSEKLFGVVEEVFYFVHQMKGFIGVRDI